MAVKLTKLMTMAAFSRLCGVSAEAVSKACKNGLTPAMVGRRIDAAHRLATAYRKKHWKNSTRKAPAKNPFSPKKKSIKKSTLKPKKPAKKSTKKTPVKIPKVKFSPAEIEKEITAMGLPEDIRDFADWTLSDIFREFGTDERFYDILKALKEIENINEKRLKNAQTQGELVTRRLVKVGIIDLIEQCHRKMLTDGAVTITKRVMAMTKADMEFKDILDVTVDIVSSFIKPVKVKVKKAI